MLRLFMLLPVLARLLLLNTADGGAGEGGDAGAGTDGGDGGAGSGGDGAGDGAEGEDADGGDKGFPANTPVAEMTVAQQAAYWRDKARKHEARVKARGDYDDLKAKAARLDEIEAANATEAEKAAKAARDEGRVEGLLAAVRAEFRAAAKGVLSDEAREALLEDLDMKKYLTDKGEVDVERIEKKVTALAPATGGTNGKVPDLGQGRRPGGTKVSGKDKGIAEARKRFGEPAATR